MNTISISLPDALKTFVDEQVAAGGYRTASDYVCELIRRERDKERLRDLILEGAASPGTKVADKAYFDALRARVRGGDFD